MTGGNRMKGYDDGYFSSPAELEKAEAEFDEGSGACQVCQTETTYSGEYNGDCPVWLCPDHGGTSWGPDNDLEALEKGLAALRLAREWLAEGGWCVPGAEEINAIKATIARLKGGE